MTVAWLEFQTGGASSLSFRLEVDTNIGVFHLPFANLRSSATAMAVGAIDLGEVSQIDRMLESGRGWGSRARSSLGF